MDTEVVSPVLTRRAFDAVLFDLDGVLTDTAALHAQAWKALFDPILAERGQPPFEIATDYRRYVDGMPREDGIRSFLGARGLALPQAELERMARDKNAHFHRLLEAHGVPRLSSSIAVLRQLRHAGYRIGVVSASRNAPRILEAAGLTVETDVLVSGVTAADEGLAGKPAPDTFLAAARKLGVPPARCAVVEDAEAGVAAGRTGGFGLVIGLVRAGADDQIREAMRRSGADLVVEDLSEVPVNETDVPNDKDAARTGDAATLPSALTHADELLAHAGDRRPAFFLDYDGTLTPIAPRPDLATLSPEMRAALQRLAAACTVAVVSGRGLADVRGLVQEPELIYAGSHGFEIEGPAGLSIQAEKGTEFLPALDEMERELNRRLAAVEGALVERKRFSIAVHYRLVDSADQPAVEAAVAEALAAHPEFRKGLGKKVYELQPDIDWNKGRAVRWLIEALELDLERVLPVYIGDDVTDEDAFRALAGDGLGILVRDGDAGATAATYTLDSPDEVRRFFERILEHLA
jgi:alpha,alpha-trehalase